MSLQPADANVSAVADDSNRRAQERARRYVALTGSGLIVLGLGVTAWRTVAPTSTPTAEGAIPMSATAAAGCLAAGCTFLALALHRRRQAVLTALALGILAAIAFALDIRATVTALSGDGVPDTLYSPLWLTVPPNMAIGFLMSTAAVLLFTRRRGLTWRPAAIAMAGAITLAFAAVSFASHVLGMEVLTNARHELCLTVPGTLGLLLLGLSTIGIAAMLAPPQPAQPARWLPLAVGAGLLVFAFVVRHALILHERENMHRYMATVATGVRSHLDAQLVTESLALDRIAGRWENAGGVMNSLWTSDVEAYLKSNLGFCGFLWLDGGFLARWCAPPELAAADWVHELPDNPRVATALQRALSNRREVFSRTFVMDDGRIAFLIATPIRLRGEPDGLIVGVMDAHSFLRYIAGDLATEQFGVVVSEGLRTIYGDPARLSGLPPHEIAHISVGVMGLSWDVTVFPLTPEALPARPILPAATLTIGIVMSLLVALNVHLGQTAARRARELEQINAELEMRVNERTRELRRALRDLERSNRDLEQFAYVASHDLQEPLRMVSSYVQLIAKRYQGKLDGDADAFIGFAVDGAERMRRLISDLLAYARLGSRGGSFAETDCGKIVHAAIQNLAVAIKESGAEIKLDTPMPPLVGDETQLIQLFQNLISNAIRFHGTQPPVVHIRAVRQQEAWAFAVQDNGIGIPPEFLDRVFVIFRRLHARDKYPGTGIGLAVCKKIVERHGGRIWVESEVDRGSTFHFTLPTEHEPLPA